VANDWPSPKTDCTPATTGVLIVHGIGVQPPGETRSAYGGPVADMWAHFGDAPGYASTRCQFGHHHLIGGGTNMALVDEAYWDDVVDEPPSLTKLSGWILTTLPISLLYTLTRPPRQRRSGVLKPIRWFAMFVRWMAGPILVLLATVAALLIVAFIAITRSTEFSARAGRAMALTLGDAYRFSADRISSEAMIDRVVQEAQRVAATTSRLVVVAHSQGGGIVLEAIQRPGWPRTSTSVVTLGSGHARLSLLRHWLSTWPRRVAVAALSGMALLATIGWWTMTGSQSDELQAGEINSSENTSFEGRLLGGTAAYTILVGLIVLFIAWRQGRRVDRLIHRHAADWTDLWAAHDLVPDGPLLGGTTPSVMVQNTASLVLDHTTYHTNGAEVISAILDRIHPPRLDPYRELLSDVQDRRAERVRSNWFVRLLEFLFYRGLRMEPPDPETTRAELRGDISTL
jgi:hypothetical protein